MVSSKLDRADESGESPLLRFRRAAERELTPLDCSLSARFYRWAALWNVIDRPARRAVIGLSLLSDEGCLLDWKARMKVLRPPRTDHLVRPGGLVETDLGWLAGVTTRASRRRVRARLEEIGAVERRTVPGRQPRFLPAIKPALAVLGHERAVGSMRELGDLVNGTARSTGGSRYRHLEPRPGVYLSGESWASTGQGLGTYIVGAEVPPSVARFFADRLEPLIRSVGEAGAGRTKEKGVYRWCRRAAREGSPVALVIRLL